MPEACCMPELFDTHCHLDVAEFDQDRDAVHDRAQQMGVKSMLLPGVDQSGWQYLCALARQHQSYLAAPGLHPLYMALHTEAHLHELAHLIQREPVVALGEIGLDYLVETLDRGKQQELFERQLGLASASRLPVLLHVRKAHDQVLATLRRRRFSCGGIVHAFGGSLQQARQYIQLGFYISLCGTITYSRAQKIRAVACELPCDCLVIETDSPDIPPANHLRERNLPEYLVEICAMLAQLRGESFADVAAYTTDNARKSLRLH